MKGKRIINFDKEKWLAKILKFLKTIQEDFLVNDLIQAIRGVIRQLSGLKTEHSEALMMIRQNAWQKITFEVSNRRKCIANLRTQPMNFREDFDKYKTQKVMNVIVNNLQILGLMINHTSSANTWSLSDFDITKKEIIRK